MQQAGRMQAGPWGRDATGKEIHVVSPDIPPDSFTQAEAHRRGQR